MGLEETVNQAIAIARGISALFSSGVIPIPGFVDIRIEEQDVTAVQLKVEVAKESRA